MARPTGNVNVCWELKVCIELISISLFIFFKTLYCGSSCHGSSWFSAIRMAVFEGCVDSDLLTATAISRQCSRYLKHCSLGGLHSKFMWGRMCASLHVCLHDHMWISLACMSSAGAQSCCFIWFNEILERSFPIHS